MAVAYKCDKCKKIFNWYDRFFYDDKLNNMDYKERAIYMDEHPEEDFRGYSANALKMMAYAPINENLATNGNLLSGEVENVAESNNILIMLCPSCMTKFTRDLQDWWDVV